MTPADATRRLIDRFTGEANAASPEAAMRDYARRLVTQYAECFGGVEIPLDMDVLASLRDIRKSELPPVQSEDAELVPDGRGGVEYRVNPDRPETRRRFSVAHEICHTFFPDFETKVWCRSDAKYRLRSDPADRIEMLCDIGASELLMPLEPFRADVLAVDSAAKLVALIQKYRASPEAVLRRYAEVHPRKVAAVFLAWKLKPTEQGTVGNLKQPNLLDIDPVAEARRALKLRIEYSVGSESFRQSGLYLPSDKSVENNGPLYAAATNPVGAAGACDLKLGPASGRYHVVAIPVWTAPGEFGPDGESAVAAILEPLEARQARSKSEVQQPSLF
jgi:hypothetical protein